MKISRSSIPGGYGAWVATNIPDGLDDSFGGSAFASGLPNGLVYVFGLTGIHHLEAGVLTAPPEEVPSDVRLVLETSITLESGSWRPILEYSAGVLTFVDADVTIDSGLVAHLTDDPVRFYRYHAELVP